MPEELPARRASEDADRSSAPHLDSLDSAAQRMRHKAGLDRIAERHKRQLDCSILQVCPAFLLLPNNPCPPCPSPAP